MTGASADFVWSIFTPEVCPTRWARGSLALSPCLGVVTGLLAAEPSGIPDSESFVRAWIAPQVTARARIALGRGLGLEVQPGLEVPLVRGRYTFGAVSVLRVPALVPTLALGLSFDGA